MKELKKVFMVAILFLAGQLLAQQVNTEIKMTYILAEDGNHYLVSYRYINNETEVEITSGEKDKPAIVQNESNRSTKLIIPETIDEKPVTKIGNYAFQNCGQFTPIIIPKNVTEIGDNAFKNCDLLKEVQLGTGLTKIGASAFADCVELTSIIIPENVTEIGNRAFQKCTQLAEIIIPDNVKTIDDFTFDQCESLEKITLGKNLMTIGVTAFSKCTKLTSIIIPNNVTTIGKTAFYQCSGLENVQLGTGLTKIGISAFQNCPALTSIIIPNNVTTIGEQAFKECTGLTKITLGEGLTTIGASAFESCSVLTSIIIPDKVTKIGEQAFKGCEALNEVQLGKGLTEIGASAFESCSVLTSIIIPDKVTTIGASAFRKCTELTNVKLGKSLTTIGASTFEGCFALIKVYFEEKTPTTVGDDIYKNINADFKNYILEKNAKFWEKDENGDFKTFGGKPVKIAGQRVVTFLSYDSEKAKKSVQKFMQHEYFRLTINKFTEKDKIFVGWKVKHLDVIYNDGDEVGFIENEILIAQWEDMKTGDDPALFNLDKNYVGLISGYSAILGSIDFKVDKNAKVSGKIITQNKSYSFSAFINYQEVDDNNNGTIKLPVFTLKTNYYDMMIYFDSENSCWRISGEGKIEGKEIYNLDANEVLTDFTGWENITDKKSFTFNGEVTAEEELSVVFLKTPFIGSNFCGTLNITKNIAKLSAILPDGSTVNLASKVTLSEDSKEDSLVLSFFAPFGGKTGYIGFKMWIEKTTGEFNINAFWENKKDKTYTFFRQLEGTGQPYDNKKVETFLKSSENKEFNFNATSTLESEDAELTLPDYPMPVKIGKINAYQNIKVVPLLPRDVKLVVKKAKVILENKSLSPFLPKGGKWSYRTDKKGGDIIDPNLTTFTFNAKTGLFNGGFSVYYDFDENGINKKHFTVKTSYKGAISYTVDGSMEGNPITNLSGKGSAQLPCTDYEPTTPGKFIKHTSKQSINVEFIKTTPL